MTKIIKPASIKAIKATNQQASVKASPKTSKHASILGKLGGRPRGS